MADAVLRPVHGKQTFGTVNRNGATDPMICTQSKFLLMPTGHAVTVPQNSSDYPELIGIKGRLISANSQGQARVLFEGFDAYIELHSEQLIDYRFRDRTL